PPRPTSLVSMFFFSSASWTSVLYTLSLHDALPIFVAVTVSISFSIVKVVLLFVRNQITQSVAIMTGDQIDRRVGAPITALKDVRSEEHTSELQSREKLVCRLLLEKKQRSRQPKTPT